MNKTERATLWVLLGLLLALIAVLLCTSRAVAYWAAGDQAFRSPLPTYSPLPTRPLPTYSPLPLDPVTACMVDCVDGGKDPTVCEAECCNPTPTPFDVCVGQCLHDYPIAGVTWCECLCRGNDMAQCGALFPTPTPTAEPTKPGKGPRPHPLGKTPPAKGRRRNK